MKHEELLKEIEEQIKKNRTRMYYGNICRNDLMENQDLLGRIKTVLRTADKEYEAKKKQQEEEAAKLKPGDVVEYNGILSKNAIFLYESIDKYWILPSLGHCPQELSKDNWILKKTGKHVDLEGLFEEMQEG